MSVSIRYDGYRKIIFFYIKNGKANPIDRNGTLFNKKGGKFSIELKSVLPTAILLCHACAGCHSIHMPLYDMSVQPAINLQASFKVNCIVFHPTLQIGLLQGLFNS